MGKLSAKLAFAWVNYYGYKLRENGWLIGSFILSKESRNEFVPSTNGRILPHDRRGDGSITFVRHVAVGGQSENGKIIFGIA
ncbi:MAG: hypothetical protein P8Y45_20465 [Exilibacterium sp.]